MSAAAAVLEASGLGLRRGGAEVLAGLSLRLAAGDSVGIMGPNGAGKTSFLRALMGFDPPAAGRLALFGTPLPCRRRGLWSTVGCVFQETSLDGELSVQENLVLGAALFGLPAAAARQRAAQVLAEVGCAAPALAHARVKRLSGGTRRRCELARALLPRPRLLLLDEATAGLDPVAARQFWGLVDRQRRQHGTAVLSATHMPDEAARVGRLLVFAGGRVVADAPPAELLAEMGGDVIACEADDPAALVAPLAARLGVRVWLQGSRLMLACAGGPALIPRLVEAAGPARLATVSLRRPTLGDVFFRLTGATLEPAGPGAADASAGPATPGEPAPSAQPATPAGPAGSAEAGERAAGGPRPPPQEPRPC